MSLSSFYTSADLSLLVAQKACYLESPQEFTMRSINLKWLSQSNFPKKKKCTSLVAFVTLGKSSIVYICILGFTFNLIILWHEV